ncbi:MAG: MarR family transcriptional regulator [Rhizobiales bacterium]|nr:MarR family transcriptional regulator [Hyphomicrobiales bacterium]
MMPEETKDSTVTTPRNAITTPMRTDNGLRFDVFERMFFAYRDFTRGPDIVLAKFGFGRAHHRVLYFVNRAPGIRMTELLEILDITKQSLARVLRQLVDAGHILQHTNPNDRRARLLYPTEKGRDLALDLSRSQSRRIEEAMESLGPAGAEAAKTFLQLLISEADRETIRKLEG